MFQRGLRSYLFICIRVLSVKLSYIDWARNLLLKLMTNILRYNIDLKRNRLGSLFMAGLGIKERFQFLRLACFARNTASRSKLFNTFRPFSYFLIDPICSLVFLCLSSYSHATICAPLQLTTPCHHYHCVRNSSNDYSNACHGPFLSKIWFCSIWIIVNPLRLL